MSVFNRTPHDAECESELTSHGQTPCRCDERSGAAVVIAQRLAEARLKMYQSERHCRGYAEDRCRAYEEALRQVDALLPPGLGEKLEADVHAIMRKALDIPQGATLDKQEREARGYLSRLLAHYAPELEPLPDLLGLCTQIDTVLVWLREQKPVTATSPATSATGAGLL